MKYSIIDTQRMNLQYLYGIHDLWGAVTKSLEGTPLDHTVFERTPQSLMLDLQSDRTIICVATPDNLEYVAGSLGVTEHPDKRGTGLMGGLMVDPLYSTYMRGRMIESLVRLVEEEAKKRGFTELEGYVEVGNRVVRKLVERSGYQEVSSSPFKLVTGRETTRILIRKEI